MKRVGWIALMLLVLPVAARAQRLLELPVRTGATPEVLATGASAAFWNPASAIAIGGRGEVVLLDVNGPDATGLAGFAGAAAVRLDPRTVLTLGYRHVGIEEMERTSTSPMPDPEGLDVAEDVFGLGAARSLNDAMAVGVGAEYTRPSADLDTDAKLVIGVGARLRLRHPWGPTLAGAVQAEEDEPGWRVAAEVAPERLRLGDWSAAFAYGLSGGPRLRGPEHRLATRVAWRERVTLSAGIAAADDNGGTAWTPLGGIVVHINRYVIGVVREHLAHDFGAVHSLRFGVEF